MLRFRRRVSGDRPDRHRLQHPVIRAVLPLRVIVEVLLGQPLNSTSKLAGMLQEFPNQ